MTRRVVIGAALAVLALAGTVWPQLSGDPPLTLGVVGFYNPRVMYLRYQPLVDYLTEHTPYRWELVISTEYQETVDLLCGRRLTLAYLGPFTYVRAHETCGANPVVRLNTGGRPVYRSVILARQDSSVRNLVDLEGMRVGFGAPLSTSSHLVPRLMLRDAGVPVSVDRAVFYGHHEQAARGVLLGEVEACGIRDIVAERFEHRGLRVVARSGPIPNFPLAATPDVPGRVRDAVVQALVTLPGQDEAARREIARWHPELKDGFARCSNSDYDSVRETATQLFGPRALALTVEELAAGGPG